jgi:integrase
MGSRLNLSRINRVYARQVHLRVICFDQLHSLTGLRRSEWIALTWSDLNIKTMEIQVLRSCVRNRFRKTKTEASNRPVPLHPIVLSALLAWRAESYYAKEIDFLFPSIQLIGWHRSGIR